MGRKIARFEVFTVCSWVRFFTSFFASCGHATVSCARHFERLVNILQIIRHGTRNVHDMFRIVYTFVFFILHLQWQKHSIFGISSQSVHTRSRERHVQIIQILGVFFYVCADCTNFRSNRPFLPFYSIFRDFRNIFPFFVHFHKRV